MDSNNRSSALHPYLKYGHDYLFYTASAELNVLYIYYNAGENTLLIQHIDTNFIGDYRLPASIDSALENGANCLSLFVSNIISKRKQLIVAFFALRQCIVTRGHRLIVQNKIFVNSIQSNKKNNRTIFGQNKTKIPTTTLI